MTSEANRWQRVRQVFQATLEQPDADRVSFLRETCTGDSDLRREVESLLDAHGAAGEHFMDSPAIEGLGASAVDRIVEAAREVPDRHSAMERIATGTRIGAYDILGLLGAGGMGVVYRARDTTLRREVAIKILPRVFTADRERLARFEREARMLAALNHPHIGAIYGLEAVEGQRALVLELVEGETLANRVQRGPVPIAEALTIARQIAEALDAAHEKGIIHRDLKPANVKVTPDGVVKVLDFGLAKLVAEEPGTDGAANSSLSPTPTISTREGVILGTAAYMSPEQARGLAVDKRTDIWAFGGLVFEILTGHAAFAGNTITDTLAAIIEREPVWSALPAATPPSINRLLRRCLEKDPKRRLRDMGDARAELEESAAPRASEQSPIVPRRRERLAWTSALALVTLLAAAVVLWALRPAARQPEMRVDITTPGPATGIFAISPDGQMLALVGTAEGKVRLFLRSLMAGTTRALTTVEALSTDEVRTNLFWSSDSRSLGFFADGKLKRVDIESGAVQILANAEGSVGNGAWNRDGTILFSPDLKGPIFRVPATGGEPIRVTPPVLAAGQPAFLPDNRHFLYTNETPESRGVYIAAVDGSGTRRLLDADQALFHAPSGHLLFLRNGTLFAQRFDAARFELTGSPFAVAEPVTVLSASAAGPIAFRAGSTRDLSYQLVWFDRSGKALEKVGDASVALWSPSMSPDGRHLAGWRQLASGDLHIWLLDLRRVALSRLTLTNARGAVNPVWSPDGRWIVFLSRGSGGAADLYRKRATGEGNEEPLLVTGEDKSPSDWSRDGRFVLYENTDPKTPGRKWQDLWALPMDGNRKPFPVVQSSFRNQNGQFSPDGKWIAYESDESGRSEIYLQPFPGPGPKTLVSTGGGAQVRWRRDGKELFYVALDERLTAVPIRLPSTGGLVGVGTPVPLFATHARAVVAPLPQQYVVTPDGGRFLMATVAPPPTTVPITLILNWKARP